MPVQTKYLKAIICIMYKMLLHRQSEFCLPSGYHFSVQNERKIAILFKTIYVTRDQVLTALMTIPG